jgi:hypothetical protein
MKSFLGHAAGDLIAAHGQGVAGEPLRFRLADADDRPKPRAALAFAATIASVSP